jgi:hypothetical protein
MLGVPRWTLSDYSHSALGVANNYVAVGLCSLSDMIDCRRSTAITAHVAYVVRWSVNITNNIKTRHQNTDKQKFPAQDQLLQPTQRRLSVYMTDWHLWTYTISDWDIFNVIIVEFFSKSLYNYSRPCRFLHDTSRIQTNYFGHYYVSNKTSATICFDKTISVATSE